MTVARSAALAALARSARVSSLTPAPPSASLRRSGLTRHRCSSAGSRSRASVMTCSNPSVSAMTARAAESDRIHSACSADEVS